MIKEKDLAEKIVESSQPNTFAGNAVIAATTITNIEILSKNDFELVKRAGKLGEQIKNWVKNGAMETMTIGDVRGRGFMIGIEMVKDKRTREPLDKESVVKIIMGMLKRGLVMVPCGRFGNVFRFMPPLVITKKHAEKASGILLDTVKAVESGKS